MILKLSGNFIFSGKTLKTKLLKIDNVKITPEKFKRYVPNIIQSGVSGILKYETGIFDIKINKIMERNNELLIFIDNKLNFPKSFDCVITLEKNKIEPEKKISQPTNISKPISDKRKIAKDVGINISDIGKEETKTHEILFIDDILKKKTEIQNIISQPVFTPPKIKGCGCGGGIKNPYIYTNVESGYSAKSFPSTYVQRYKYGPQGNKSQTTPQVSPFV